MPNSALSARPARKDLDGVRGGGQLLPAAVAALTLGLDQLTKLAVARNLGICERSAVWGGFLRLTHIRNSGAVFGMMRGAGVYFTFFSVVAAIVLVVVLFFSRKASALVKISLGMLLGGALGNLIDRLRPHALALFQFG
jgi:signal peptidase II